MNAKPPTSTANRINWRLSALLLVVQSGFGNALTQSDRLRLFASVIGGSFGGAVPAAEIGLAVITSDITAAVAAARQV